ncbi:MAG: DUF3341 domain-containing protein [Thermoanaerobaculia bacterium]|nr:DUF3341 domain-containing protein [Thermoanaerobaculia bacterium]
MTLLPEETSGRLYGLLAEFSSPGELIDATRKTREEGYREMDAYSPFPSDELVEALGNHHSKLPLLVLIGGLVGCFGGFGLQWWVNEIAYPINIGGRPLNSWPAFIPVTFETTILVAGIVCVLGFFALCGLPQPYHPVFNVERFSAASRDRYFLCVEAEDPTFDLERTREFLENLGATEVSEVEY